MKGLLCFILAVFFCLQLQAEPAFVADYFGNSDSCSIGKARELFQAAGEAFTRQDYFSAEADYHAASQCFREQSGQDSLYLLALMGEAMSLYKLNQLEKARLNYHTIIELNQKDSFLHPALLASVFHNTGLIYQQQFDLQMALEYQKKAVELKEKLGIEEDIRGSAWNNLGALYEQLVQPAEACQCYEKALTCFIKGGDHARLLTINLNLARLKQMQDNPEEAGMYLDAAMLHARKKGNVSSSLRRELLYSMAVKHFQQKNFKAAYRNCQEMEKLSDSVNAGQHIREASLKACCLEKLSRNRDAAHVFEQKFDYNPAQVSDLAAMGAHLMAKALFLQNQEKEQEALETMHLSVRCYEDAYGQAATAALYARMHLGDLHYRSKRYPDALKESDAALRMALNSGLSYYPPLIIDLMEVKALAAYALFEHEPNNTGLLRLATDMYVQMAGIISRERLLLPEWSSLEWGSNYRLLFENGIKIAVQACRNKDTAGIQPVRDLMQLNKALVLRKELNDNDILSSIPAGDPALLQFKEEDRANVHRRFMIELELAKATPEFETIAGYEIDFLESHRLLDSLKKVLCQRYPAVFASLVPGIAYTCRDFLSADTGKCILEFFTGDDIITVLLTCRGFQKVISWERHPNLEITIYSYLKDLKLVRTDSFLAHGSALYQMILKPVEAELRAFSQLVIIPDAELWAVPFDALIRNADSAEKGDSPHYLLDDFVITMAYSGRGTGHNAAPKHLPEEIVIHAPDPSLVYSIKELEKISALARAKGIPLKAYSGKQSTPQSFLSQLAGKGILHISSHALADPKHPQLAALGFSGSEVLREGEIYTQQTNLALVVLNACETQKGQIASSEGMLSLARAFLSCGADEVIAGLWRIQDEQAYEIMVGFYNNLLSGKSGSEALTQAKRKMRQLSETAFPRNWAAWQLLQP
jgi:CHAT domain-containing protein/tetratricopeptide (TPR) repeat protein